MKRIGQVSMSSMLSSRKDFLKGAFEEAGAKQKASFGRMYASLPSVPQEYERARRDPAYTWTASAFLVLAHELEERQ